MSTSIVSLLNNLYFNWQLLLFCKDSAGKLTNMSYGHHPLSLCNIFIVIRKQIVVGSYRYAGEIHGITNTFTAIAGIIVPSLVNALTPNVRHYFHNRFIKSKGKLLAPLTVILNTLNITLLHV